MKRTVIILASAAAVALGAAACSNSPGSQSAAQNEQKQSNSIEQNALINQPVPVFQHSDIRATAISIEAIQALGEQTTSFGFNQGIKDPVWSCPSLGEPVASTDEITNPSQVIQGTNGTNGNAMAAVGNMDPNGIYSGQSTGTYVLCVNAQGTPYAQYWEGFVDTVSGPAVWNAATGTIQVTGAPTMPTCTTANRKTVCVK